LRSVLEDVRARGLAATLVFDVGASDGSWSAVAREVFPETRVVLVEPRTEMHSVLGELATRDPRHVLVAAAAGASEGHAVLTVADTSSTLRDVTWGAPQVTVPVTTLDAVAAQHGYPEIVKLDVEGFEVEVLRGATTLFGRTELFILETALFDFGEPRPLIHDVIDFMAEHDYVPYDIAGFIRRPFDGAVGLLDVCFARRNGVLRRDRGAWHAPDPVGDRNNAAAMGDLK
jgi:FkbM family methyltransferase